MATIICPSCGGENQITGKSRKECAYCGSPLPMPEKKKTSAKKSETKGDAKFPTAQYYIPINDDLQDKESVIAAFRQYLVSKDNIPVDIFDNMEIVDVKWYYLPMIRYAGDVDTEWSCNQVVAKQREIGQRPIRDKNGAIVRWETEYETYYDYIPKSGRGHSTFDVLVPCGTGLKPIGGMKSCYYRIDFVDIDDINAQEWPIKGSVTPRNAYVDSSLADLAENNHEILEDVAREVYCTAKRCSFKPFREDERSDEHLNYSQKLTSSTGELFYIPYVHVVYRYNGATYDWAFLQSPLIREDGIHPELDEEESPVAMLQAEFLEKRKKLERKEIWSMALSFVFTTPIGGVIYFLMTNSKISKAKRRLNTQMDLATLLYRLKRKERLAAHGGGSAKISDEDIEDLYDETAGDYDGPEDSWLYDGGEKPTTIAGIEEYFEETEKVYKRALKSIRNFWWDILIIILLVGGGILGYLKYQDIQQEKIWEEEQSIMEEEQSKYEAEMTEKFNNEFVGNTYEGSNLKSYDEKFMKISIIDDSHLKYQIGASDIGQYDEKYNKIVNWSSPKTVEYKLSISHNKDNYTEKHICLIVFDGYTSGNLMSKGNDYFDNEIRVPVDKEEPYEEYFSESYHLERCNK